MHPIRHYWQGAPSVEFDLPGVLVAMLSNSVTALRREMKSSGATRASACHYAKRSVCRRYTANAYRGVGYVFQMITLAGDIGIFQHTTSRQVSKVEKSNTTIKQRLRHDQAPGGVRVFSTSSGFPFCLVLHPDDSQPAFL